MTKHETVGTLILACVLVWWLATGFVFRPAGAIGNDPATYVQMALDLAQRGTPVHAFPLFESLREQSSSWDAFLTPGYRVVPTTGATAPVFAIGLPLLLAAAYRLFGDGGLYLLVPALGGLSILVTYLLALRLLAAMPAPRFAAALAAVLLATAPKQITHALVPMSDVPAQLFAALALWCAIEARETSKAQLAWAVACGLSLGAGYLARHAVILMALPIGLVAWRWGGTPQARAACIALAAMAFGLASLPDLVYRSTTLGSLLAAESPESTVAALSNIPANLWRMAGSLVSAHGFGPLALVAPIGLWALRRSQRLPVAAILIAWIGAFALFHAPLMLTGVFENDLRYVLPAYPALAIAMAAGSWQLAVGNRRMADGSGQTAVARMSRVVVVLALAAALAYAARGLARAPGLVSQTYGWLGNTARQDIEALAPALSLPQGLPADAAIGAADQQAGALLLYSGHDIFRPGSFVNPSVEFPRFLRLMREQGRSVFVVGDLDCRAPDVHGDQLPSWLSAYTMGPTGIELRGLPASCRQKVYTITSRET